MLLLLCGVLALTSKPTQTNRGKARIARSPLLATHPWHRVKSVIEANDV